MPRVVRNLGFTVPPEMADAFELIARRKQRTKSELFREMFRMYQMYDAQIEQAKEKHLEQLAHSTISSELSKKTSPLSS